MRELGVIGVFLFIIVQLNRSEDINQLKKKTKYSVSQVTINDSIPSSNLYVKALGE